MLTTLEMPSDAGLNVSAPAAVESQAANEAADILESLSPPEGRQDRAANLADNPVDSDDPLQDLFGDADDDSPHDTNAATGGPPADAAVEEIGQVVGVAVADSAVVGKDEAGNDVHSVEVAIESPVDPPVSVAEQQAKVETSRATRKFQLAETTERYVQICLNIQECEDTIANAKDRMKALEAIREDVSRELRELRNGELWQPSLFPPADKPKASATVAESAPPAADAAAVAPSADPDAWRSVSIDELRLPPKLAEKLKEANAETIGRLEDLRAQISQGREKWPRGIGAAKITEIENAVVEWLTKNRDSGSFATVVEAGDAILGDDGKAIGVALPADAAAGDVATAVEPAAEAAVDKPAPKKRGRKAKAKAEPDEPAASDAAADNPASLADIPYNDMSDDQQRAFILGRVKAINDGSPNCLDQKLPNKVFWERGYDSFGEVIDGKETEVTDCIYAAGPEMDDWIRGFLAAKLLDDMPDAGTDGEKAEAGSDEEKPLDEMLS